MIECNDLYDYGLKIYQNRNYFKFSLDSILLAEFIKLKKGDNVLDLCTGNAPIPMILTTKYEEISIDAVEVQKEIYSLAKKSIDFNGIDNINLYNADINDFASTKKYDVISCNPPYFDKNSSQLENQNTIKNIARHEVLINLNDIVTIVKRNLKETGTFYLVHRINRLLETIELFKKNKLGIRKIVFVNTKKDCPAEFFLIEGSNYKKDDVKIFTIDAYKYTSYKGIFEKVM